MAALAADLGVRQTKRGVSGPGEDSMPPTFVYIMAFLLWLALAAAVWVAAGAIALFPTMRRTGASLALAMAGTFPAVIAYQVLAAPFVLAILLGVRLIWKTLEPGRGTSTENPVVIVVSLTGALLALGVAAGMSVAGFVEGWRAGWRVARGEDVMSALRTGPFSRGLRAVRRFTGKGE